MGWGNKEKLIPLLRGEGKESFRGEAILGGWVWEEKHALKEEWSNATETTNQPIVLTPTRLDQRDSGGT